jgi:hypothetical protein
MGLNFYIQHQTFGFFKADLNIAHDLSPQVSDKSSKINFFVVKNDNNAL